MIPSITIGFIITNISQHSVRRELKYNALLLTEFVGDSINSYLSDTQEKLTQIAKVMPYLNDSNKKKYMQDIAKSYGQFEKIEVIPSYKRIGTIVFEPENHNLKMYADLNNNQVLEGVVNTKNLKSFLMML